MQTSDVTHLDYNKQFSDCIKILWNYIEITVTPRWDGDAINIDCLFIMHLKCCCNHSIKETYTTNTNLPSCHIISYSKLVTPTNVNESPSQTATAVGFGVGVSVGVVILVASVLVVIVIASRKSKYTNTFHLLFNMPFWLLSYITPGLYKYVYFVTVVSFVKKS